MKKHLTYVCLWLLIIGCKKDHIKVDPTPLVPEVALEFTIKAEANPGKVTEDVPLTIEGDSIKGYTPTPDNNHTFILSFQKNEADVVKVNDAIQVSGVTENDFSKPVKYTITTAKGETKTYAVTIFNFTGLPVFTITTASPVVSKDDYVTGSVSINPNVNFDQDIKDIELQIKGRGNSTWDMPKKPYRLKLNTKTKILGLTAAKNWVLLANYADKTLMRNYIGDRVSQWLKGDFAPHGIFVEVVMNGEYLGNYLLTEQVEVNPGRVDITELKSGDTSPGDINGGYLLELDERLDEDYWFRTASNLPFTIKSPEDITPLQLSYIHTFMQDTENAIFAADFADPAKGYAKYINSDSFINWFLVSELFKNQDSKGYSSIFYYKDRNRKLGMGPIWDLDLGAGNVDYSDAVNPEGWWVRDGLWFSRLFQDPAFRAKVKARWDQFKATEVPAMYADIDETERYLTLSAKANFTRWDILNIKVWPNPVVLGTYPNEVAQLKKWFTQRVAWLDANIKP